MKLKKLTALITALLLTFSAGACGVFPTDSSTPVQTESVSDSNDSADNSDDSSTDESTDANDSSNSNDSSDNSENDSDNSDNSDSEDDSENDTEDEEKPHEINEEHCLIVDQAYALSYNGKLGSGYTLEGEIIRINEPYASGSIGITFFVWGRESSPIYCYKMQGVGIENLQVGDYVTVYGTIKNYKGTVEFDKNCLLLSYVSNGFSNADDPYVNVSASAFYANYTPATSAADAYYRTRNGFMSGALETPDQAPQISAYQPKRNGKFIRNTNVQLSKDKKTCTVSDAYGNPAFEVYIDGAYITLEEVAAYVYAFGTYPANYTPDKNAEPDESIWGKYLRLNHTKFSGDTDKYPYEPILPNITGEGGDLQYWEMDIGTTGTDCDPSYPSKLYNTGSTITRGAARIVYGKDDLNGNGVYEYGEHHLFYTYNHYNDFQEYLGYVGGWGEMFGNITGGGTISSTSHYKPTKYIEVYFEAFTPSQKALAAVYQHRYQENAFKLL